MGGLGSHYHGNHGGSTATMVLTVIDTVAPGNHDQLDRKEEFWMHQLRTLDYMGWGGLNRRDDLVRKDRSSCDCRYCKRRGPGG